LIVRWIFRTVVLALLARAWRERQRLLAIYRRETASGARPIEAVGTTVAAFVGIAPKG
jgi:hypothetical protein